MFRPRTAGELATPTEPQSTPTRGADNTGVAYEERVTP
jgi:hypothetical protein